MLETKNQSNPQKVKFNYDIIFLWNKNTMDDLKKALTDRFRTVMFLSRNQFFLNFYLGP